MAVKCLKCETVVQVAYYCDEDENGGPFCTRCFEKHPCRTEPHDEGCETQMVDDNPNLEE